MDKINLNLQFYDDLCFSTKESFICLNTDYSYCTHNIWIFFFLKTYYQIKDVSYNPENSI
jgi:hypothetical protein